MAYCQRHIYDQYHHGLYLLAAQSYFRQEEMTFDITDLHNKKTVLVHRIPCEAKALYPSNWMRQFNYILVRQCCKRTRPPIAELYFKWNDWSVSNFAEDPLLWPHCQKARRSARRWLRPMSDDVWCTTGLPLPIHTLEVKPDKTCLKIIKITVSTCDMLAPGVKNCIRKGRPK